MKPREFFKNFIYIAALLNLFSCSRAVQDSAELVIKLPGQSLNYVDKINQSNYVNNLVASNLTASIQSSSDDWSSVEVTSMRNLNCFFVIAGGPDMERFKCAKHDSTFKLISEEHLFSEIAGPARLGGELKMQVLSGKNRVFKLFGMNAASEKDCKILSDPTFSKSNFSKPYLIGQSEPTEIVVGKQNEVKIAPDSIFNQRSYVDYCTIGVLQTTKPAFRTSGAVEFKIKNGGFGQNYHDMGCVPITASILDENGRVKISDVKDRFELLAGVSSADEITTYKSLYDCHKNIVGSNKAEFETADLGETPPVWTKLRRPSNPATYFELVDGVSGTITVNDTLDIATIFPSINDISPYVPTMASELSIMALVPEVVRNNVCTPIRITRSAFDFSDVTGSRLSIGERIDLQVESTVSGTQDVQFYETANCSDAPKVELGTNQVRYNVDSSQKKSINAFVKLTGFSTFDRIKLKITHLNSDSTPVARSSAFYSATVDAGLSSDFDRFVIQGPGINDVELSNSFLAPKDKCLGPFRIYPVNKFGAYIQLPINYQLQLRIGNLVSDKIYAPLIEPFRSNSYDNPCAFTENEITMSTNISIGGVAPSYFEFYVKPTSYLNSKGEYSQLRYILLNSTFPTTDSRASFKLYYVDPDAGTNSIGGTIQSDKDSSDISVF